MSELYTVPTGRRFVISHSQMRASLANYEHIKTMAKLEGREVEILSDAAYFELFSTEDEQAAREQKESDMKDLRSGDIVELDGGEKAYALLKSDVQREGNRFYETHRNLARESALEIHFIE